VGYDAIYAARLAVREQNAQGGAGGYRVELVAYDDGGDAQAAVERAGQLALDPQVVAVIGHYRVETTRAAWEVYSREALPLIAPIIPADSLPDARCTGCGFPAAFRTGPSSSSLSGTVGLDEVLAGTVPTGTVFLTDAPWPAHMLDVSMGMFIARYREAANGAEPGPYAWATHQAIQMLFAAMDSMSGPLTRSSLGAQLAKGFDSRGMLADVPVYVYRLDGKGRPALLEQR
jgi:ABC-type branched-subunit amino acid transport system substrate-binding protein